jgi:hypothetical protein
MLAISGGQTEKRITTPEAARRGLESAMAIYWEYPYCECRFSERILLKQHLLDKYYPKVAEIAKSCRKPQTLSWAAGWVASFRGYREE